MGAVGKGLGDAYRGAVAAVMPTPLPPARRIPWGNESASGALRALAPGFTAAHPMVAGAIGSVADAGQGLGREAIRQGINLVNYVSPDAGRWLQESRLGSVSAPLPGASEGLGRLGLDTGEFLTVPEAKGGLATRLGSAALTGGSINALQGGSPVSGAALGAAGGAAEEALSSAAAHVAGRALGPERATRLMHVLGGEEAPDFKPAINRFEKALGIGRSASNLGVRPDIERVAPDLRRIAQSGALRGVPKKQVAARLSDLMKARADEVRAARAETLAPIQGEPVSEAPIGDEILKLAHPEASDPEALRINSRLASKAAQYAGKQVPLSKLEADRAYFDEARGNRQFFANKKPIVQKFAEARHRGSVRALDEAVGRLRPDVPKPSQLNMQAGALRNLARRTRIQAIGSEWREPSPLQRLGRAAHGFISMRSGMEPGLFVNPTGALQAGFDPNGVNALLRSSMRRFGAVPRPNLRALLRRPIFRDAEEAAPVVGGLSQIGRAQGLERAGLRTASERELPPAAKTLYKALHHIGKGRIEESLKPSGGKSGGGGRR